MKDEKGYYFESSISLQKIYFNDLIRNIELSVYKSLKIEQDGDKDAVYLFINDVHQYIHYYSRNDSYNLEELLKIKQLIDGYEFTKFKPQLIEETFLEL